jgi:hypothetical protein
MGLFDFFLSDHKKAFKMLGTMYGVDTSGAEPLTEAAEWLEELPETDTRRQRIPGVFLDGDYFLISSQRELGTVIRVTPDDVEVRCTYEAKLPTGVTIPDSHLLRSLPIRALLALKKQRAQKVIRNLVSDSQDTYQEHHRVCRVCYERFPPKKYPGHPNKGILGPPAYRVFTCEPCKRKKEMKEAEEAAKNAAEKAAKKKAESEAE